MAADGERMVHYKKKWWPPQVLIANHCRLGSPIRLHLLKLIPTVKMNSNQLEPPTSLFSNGGSNLKTVHSKKFDDDPPLPTASAAELCGVSQRHTNPSHNSSIFKPFDSYIV